MKTTLRCVIDSESTFCLYIYYYVQVLSALHESRTFPKGFKDNLPREVYTQLYGLVHILLPDILYNAKYRLP